VTREQFEVSFEYLMQVANDEMPAGPGRYGHGVQAEDVFKPKTVA